MSSDDNKDGKANPSSDYRSRISGSRFMSDNGRLDKDELFKKFEALKTNERDDMSDELGKALIKATKNCDHEGVKKLISQGAPVNYIDEFTKATALHIAASQVDRRSMLALLKTDQCDLLIKDKRGWLASEVADYFGDWPAAARMLGHMEVKQAQERGIDPESLLPNHTPK